MNKKISIILMTILSLVILSGCQVHENLQTDSDSLNNQISQTQTNNNETEAKESTQTIEASNEETHEKTTDYNNLSVSSNKITLKGDSASFSGNGVTIDNNIITINSAGSYLVSGTLNNGQLLIDTEDEETVKIIFDNVSLTSKDDTPFFVKQAKKVILVLQDGTENTLIDSDEYESINDNEPNATIFSKADLTIYSENGATLNVNGNFGDGINSKDGLLIKNVTLNLKTQDDGIRGKDYLVLESSTINIEAQDEGLKSDNEEAGLGYITLKNSSLEIMSQGDAISAQTNVLVDNTNLNLNAGGGSSTKYSGDGSYKGIKAAENIAINSGQININSADDTIHSNNTLTINGGTLNLSSGDDGIHADKEITINGGNIKISKSYEGIESSVININDGSIYIVASDDGLNVAGGNDSSSFGRPGAGGFDAADEGSYLNINGGYVYINANGDGLDSNGSIVMTGGQVVVDGPTNNGNGPTDYNGTFVVSGGWLLTVGSSGMAQATSQESTQNAILVNFDSMQTAGTLINIQDENGENILTYAPAKQYQSVLFSSSDIETGETYSLYLGGETTGTATNGLYTQNTYSSGTLNTTLDINSSVTTSGATGRGMGGGPGGGMDNRTPGEMPTDMNGDFDPGMRTRPTR